MGRVAGDDQQERLDDRLPAFPGVGLQLHLHALVEPDPVLQLQPLDLLGRHAGGVEVLPGDNRRLLDEAVRHGLAERVVIDHVLEGHRPLARLHERRGRQLQSQDRLQLVDRPDARRCPVAVRLVHDQDEVLQPGQVVEVALTDVLRQALDPGRLPATHLGVDLGDIEDVDVHLVLVAREQPDPHPGPLLVGVPGDDHRGFGGEFGDAGEDVLRRVRREIRGQLVVDGQIGGEDEEVAEAVGQVEIADEGPHEPGLADAGGQREAERWKLPLEVGHRRELAADGLQGGLDVRPLLGRGDLGDPVQDLQRPPLGWAQAQPPGDGVDVAVHALFPRFFPVGFLGGNFFRSLTMASNCFSTSVGWASCLTWNLSNSLSALAAATSWLTRPACVRMSRSLRRRKSSSLAIQSCMYMGRRFWACNSANSR